ncbi:formimidoylglutamase [Virgibacillus siamensis]|uniref:formimidoylglutamase n=1 Tax=Virgibacillus siamensis TaxID=480071 RepID=UPI00098447AA|nr:formimidoylglutamase [Virgibacillus siamensis]
MYELPNKNIWQGRVDSETETDKFRFHQVVQLWDVSDEIEEGNAFGIIGFKCDEGVRRNKGNVGASLAPDEVRKMIAKLPYNIDENVSTYDVGNVLCESDKLENAQSELGDCISNWLNQFNIPIIIGGGHETLYGHYLGIRRFLGEEASLGIINIDAHFDLRTNTVPSSGTMFKQILEKDMSAGYLCLGIQEFSNTKALFNDARIHGCKYIPENELNDNKIKHAFNLIDEFAGKYDFIMLTLDMDSIAASDAPGVSAPSPFGLEVKIVRRLLRYIVSKNNITSFDISEVNPSMDENDKTIRLAANLIAEVMKNFKGINPEGVKS